jgi:hypothetical protein
MSARAGTTLLPHHEEQSSQTDHGAKAEKRNERQPFHGHAILLSQGPASPQDEPTVRCRNAYQPASIRSPAAARPPAEA